jgi:hypothetical protein
MKFLSPEQIVQPDGRPGANLVLAHGGDHLDPGSQGFSQPLAAVILEDLGYPRAPVRSGPLCS